MIIRQYTQQVVVPVILICTLLFILMLMIRISSLSVWDDAYMFVRYADNFLNYGNLAWNPNDISTYGLTSPAYLIIVLPLRLLFPTEPALVMLLSSLMSGLFAFVTMIWLMMRLVLDRVLRRILLLLLAISFVVAGDSITTHLTSGMDTMFSIWIVLLWLSALYLSDNKLWLGIFSGLFFVVRPDVLILTIGIIPILLVSRNSYSQWVKFATGLTIALLIQVAFAWLYFDHPIPLPFYAKTIPTYSEQFYGYYTNSSWNSFIEFLRSYPYTLAIILMGLITQYRKWDWQDKSILIGSIAFSAYHILFVTPIMGFSQRFFHPLLPVLIVLNIRFLPHLMSFIPAHIVQTLRNYPLKFLFTPILLALILINPTPIIFTLVQYTQPEEIPRVGMGHIDLQTTYDYLYFDNWYGLDQLSKFNDVVVIATTEIGLPGVMNPNKKIIDLAGLNQPNFAIEDFSVDWLMSEENQPDWIYMPFPHYEGMWFSIATHPVFMESYELFSAQSLDTSMDVAIKRSSKFYSDMLDIIHNDN